MEEDIISNQAGLFLKERKISNSYKLYIMETRRLITLDQVIREDILEQEILKLRSERPWEPG